MPVGRGPGRPFVKGDPRAGRPKGRKNGKTKELKEFLNEVRTNPDYQASLRRRLESGRAPHVEALIVRDELGDPKQKVDVQGTLVIKWRDQK